MSLSLNFSLKWPSFSAVDISYLQNSDDITIEFTTENSQKVARAIQRQIVPLIPKTRTLNHCSVVYNHTDHRDVMYDWVNLEFDSVEVRNQFFARREVVDLKIFPNDISKVPWAPHQVRIRQSSKKARTALLDLLRKIYPKLQVSHIWEASRNFSIIMGPVEKERIFSIPPSKLKFKVSWDEIEAIDFVTKRDQKEIGLKIGTNHIASVAKKIQSQIAPWIWKGGALNHCTVVYKNNPREIYDLIHLEFDSMETRNQFFAHRKIVHLGIEPKDISSLFWAQHQAKIQVQSEKMLRALLKQIRRLYPDIQVTQYSKETSEHYLRMIPANFPL